MKNKELISELQKLDPEVDVCIGNEPLFDVEYLPAYYDGRKQELIQDYSNPYYNVIGARFTNKGHKISLRGLSIRDAIWDNPDLPVEYDLPDSDKERHEKIVSGWRQEVRKCNEEIKQENIKENKMSNFKTSFGMYVPCDYETYKKLKAIKAVINTSRLKIERWKKWVRKDEKNRLQTKAIMKDGKKLGTEVVGPSPEPSPCPVFFEKKKKKVSYNYKGEWVGNVELDFWQEKVYKDYASPSLPQKWIMEFNCTEPKAEDQHVHKLSVSSEEVNEMYNLVKDWHEKNCKRAK